jgi:hypothetical protein
MIDRTHELRVVRQCPILELARSNAYFQPQPVSETDLALMRRIDTLHLEHPPFARARMLRRMLKRTSWLVGLRYVGTLEVDLRVGETVSPRLLVTRTAQPIDVGDKTILNASLVEFGKDGEPELGVFSLAHPESVEFFLPLEGHAQGHRNRFRFHHPLLPRFHKQTIKIQNRIHGLQRPTLPGANLRNGPRFSGSSVREISACHYAASFTAGSKKYTASDVWRFNA